MKKIKELNLKIKTCQYCPFAISENPGFSCSENNKRICDISVCLSVAGIPDWCHLKDCREQGVKVGVSVFVFNEKKEILIGHRTPDDLWGLPGGGMIAGETPKETAKRETEEETGLEIDPEKIYFATFTNDVFLKEKNEHWITLYFICNYDDWTGLPERIEPNKCSEWKWSNLDQLPPNLFCEWGQFIPELKDIISFSRR